MQTIDHDNIVRMYGVVLDKDNSLMLVSELKLRNLNNVYGVFTIEQAGPMPYAYKLLNRVPGYLVVSA